ncbi:MAG: SGNH/GDSL hydrolase family protein [Candidatus Izemoplasmatales bacterium]
MRRFLATLTILLTTLAFASCGVTTTAATTATTVPTTAATTTTLEALSVPANLAVSDNAVTFDPVDGASRYRIRLSQGETIVGEWFVASGFDLSLLADYGAYDLQIKAVAGTGFADSPFGEKIAVELVDPNATDVLEGETLNDFTMIRWIGRTWYDALTSRRYFWNTASGFTVTFRGTELKATFLASDSGVVSRRAHLVVLLDGEEDPTKGTTIVLDQMQTECVLAEGLEDGLHTVKVLKRSEAQDSDTAVVRVVTDGSFATPDPVKDFKIQYIGASTSVGYGDLGPSSAVKNTENSDGLLCFTYLTSYLLDAETSIFASSGWGLTRGWNTGGQASATQTIPAAYEYFATNSQNVVFTAAGQWDHSDYDPDVIVIALGGNDFSSSNYASLSADQQALFREAVTDALVAFVTTLRAYHPDTYIVLVYGLMSEAQYVQNVSIDAAARAALEFDRISSLKVAGAGSDGAPLGANWHPNVDTYIKAAGQLADHISALTGREVVREDIVY